MTPYRLRTVAMDDVYTVILIWRGKDPRYTEVRGDGYRQWTDLEPCTKSPAQRLHDGLIGPHASMLHAGLDLFIMDFHPDYEHVARFFDS